MPVTYFVNTFDLLNVLFLFMRSRLLEVKRLMNVLLLFLFLGGSKEILNTLEEIRKTFLYAANNYSKVFFIV